jgi:hypothetical protein
MTTPAKKTSNRQNALQSTGPQTQEGKAIASKNATKHGLLSREVLLPNENAEALAELAQRLREDLQPVGELEDLLVDRVISFIWRLRRLVRVEGGIFTSNLYEELAERAERKARSYEQNTSLEAMMMMMSVRITDEKKRAEALAKAKEMRDLQAEESSIVALAFARDVSGADAFSKLSRYETAIERGFYRALHELQRLQAARAGANVPLPMTVDVEVADGNGTN